MIPFSAKQKILYLNRDDLNLLSKDFSAENSELQLVIDEKLQRGDCRFESERIQINATMDARLKDIFSQLKL
jgi:flagellar biosynthesis/type III secretory pathway protein FliH